MSIRNAMQRKEAYQEQYDEREARLKKSGQTIEKWEPKEDEAASQEVEDYYEEVGRLKTRLEATRTDLEEMRERRGDWDRLQEKVDAAITELEEAVAKAAPRFQ